MAKRIVSDRSVDPGCYRLVAKPEILRDHESNHLSGEEMIGAGLLVDLAKFDFGGIRVELRVNPQDVRLAREKFM